MGRSSLKQEAMKRRTRFYWGQKLWSIAHHGSLFGSIACSVIASVQLQNTSSAPKVHPAIFTIIAAALTTLAATGGFERKWKSNRLSRSRMDCLLIDIDIKSQNLTDLAKQFKDIITTHDAHIVDSEHLANQAKIKTPQKNTLAPPDQ